jgi:hypothetical protein
MAHVYFTPWLFMHVIIQSARTCFYFNVYSYDKFCLIIKQISITSTYLLC